MVYANQQNILVPHAQRESASGKANNFQEMARFLINFYALQRKLCSLSDLYAYTNIFCIIIKI